MYAEGTCFEKNENTKKKPDKIQNTFLSFLIPSKKKSKAIKDKRTA